MAEQMQKVPGVLEQKLITHTDAEIVEYKTNEFLLECVKSRHQVTNISHVTWGEKLLVIISYLRPLEKDELPAEAEVKEL